MTGLPPGGHPKPTYLNSGGKHTMIKNYLVIALRNLSRHKGYTAINVFGLAIGIACCILVGLYVRMELSYDRFHEASHRIYRVGVEAGTGDRVFNYARIGGGIAPAMVEEFPGVLRSARFLPIDPAFLLRDDQRIEETKFFAADSTALEVFSFDVIHGSSRHALDEPFSLVLTRSMARKYFGRSDVVGDHIGFEFNSEVHRLRVTAVIEDLPVNTHFPFDFLVSMSTFPAIVPIPPGFFDSFHFTAFYAYILVDEHFDRAHLEEALPAFLLRHRSAEAREFVSGLFLQPLESIHLHSNLLAEIQPNGNIRYVYVFIAIALLTLVLACINFMNLATARSSMRAREIGLRKVLGSQRRDLVGQFLGESLAVTAAAMIVGVILAEFALPYFNAATGQTLSIAYGSDPLFWFALLVLLLVVGIGAGAYPAFFLSAFQPVQVLKGRLPAGMQGAGLRRALVVGQFAITIAFLVGALGIYRQLQYIRTTDLGFDREHRLVVPVFIDNQNNQRVATLATLKEEFERIPGVHSVSTATGVPGQLRQITPLALEGRSDEDYIQATTISVDHDYDRTMGLRLLDGRFFERGRSTDSTEAFVINHAAARQLGLDNPVGERIVWHANLVRGPNTPERRGIIIGVFADMHYEPLHREISPMVLIVNPQNDLTLITALAPGRGAEAIARMEQIWRQTVPTRAFSYTYLEDDLNEIYRTDAQLGALVNMFTALAMVVACLGLFGLSLFTVQQRTREVGIRKVIGASSGGILAMFLREFSLLVLVASVAAFPLAYLFVSQWLESFHYHAGISFGIFLMAGTAILVIALLTVSFQTIRIAFINPAESLRAE